MTPSERRRAHAKFRAALRSVAAQGYNVEESRRMLGAWGYRLISKCGRMIVKTYVSPIFVADYRGDLVEFLVWDAEQEFTYLRESRA